MTNLLTLRYIKSRTTLILLAVLWVSCNSSHEHNNIDSAFIIIDTSDYPLTQTKAIDVLPHSSDTVTQEKFSIRDFDTVHISNKIYYIVDDDNLVSRGELLRRLLINRFLDAKPKFAPETKSIQKAVIIRDDNNQIIRWRTFPIRYCIDKRSFSAGVSNGYSTVKKAFQAAAAEWEDVCGVKFDYRFDLDNKTNVHIGRDVDFVVTYRSEQNENYVAFSFYPEEPNDKHFVLVYPNYYTTQYDATGVFRHEIGHIFGLRHEQAAFTYSLPSRCKISPDIHQAPVIIKYDQASVMHYFCGGGGTYSLTFSANDRKSFRLLYP